MHWLVGKVIVTRWDAELGGAVKSILIGML